MNSYSPFLSLFLSQTIAKKNLDPTAIAGLAAKLDFTTVKLRKTGIVEQMFSEQSGGTTVDNRIEPPGMEYNTQHPVMLLQVKGVYIACKYSVFWVNDLRASDCVHAELVGQ